MSVEKDVEEMKVKKRLRVDSSRIMVDKDCSARWVRKEKRVTLLTDCVVWVEGV